jgi:hypothetical protein
MNSLRSDSKRNQAGKTADSPNGISLRDEKMRIVPRLVARCKGSRRLGFRESSRTPKGLEELSAWDRKRKGSCKSQGLIEERESSQMY